MFAQVRNRILKLLSPSLMKPSGAQRRSATRRLFRACPLCGGELTGHSHWKLASVILSTQKESEGDLAELIARRQWHQAIQYKDWAPDQDVKEYHVIRCPDDPRFAIVVVVSLAAMWSDDYTQSTIELDVEDTKTILELAADQWEPF